MCIFVLYSWLAVAVCGCPKKRSPNNFNHVWFKQCRGFQALLPVKVMCNADQNPGEAAPLEADRGGEAKGVILDPERDHPGW